MTKIYLLTFTLLLFVYSCKTASKSFQRGDYKEAIEQSVKKLQKDPYDAESADILKNAYKLAVNQHEENIRSYSNSKNPDRFINIYNEYIQLQNLYSLVRQTPAAAKVVNAVNYSEYVETYRDKVVEVYVQNAEKWESQNTKMAAREAYKEYRKALNYRPNDVDLKSRRDAAYNAAVTKVLVIPIQRQYGYSDNYQLQNFQSDVMRTLSFNMGSEFVKFYSEWDLRNRDLEPDQVMELNLGRILLGRPYDERSSREVSKKVVVKETVYKPDSVVKEYATVRAKITTTKRILISEGDLYITLRDPRGRTIWSDRFTGQHRWQTEFATYTGDERALTDSDKNLLNRREDYPPSESEVLNRLFQRINEDLSYRLRNYYARY